MRRPIALCTAMMMMPLLCAGCATVSTTDVTDGASVTENTAQTAGTAAEAPGGEKPAKKTDPGVDLVHLAADIESRGDKATALTLYERAVSVSNNRSDIRLELAQAYERADRGDEAFKIYRAVLETEPNNGLALVYMGSALVKKGNLEQGVASLSKAAPLLKSPGAYDRLGVAQTLAGRPKEAVVSLQRAHELAPNDLDVTTNLALATALAGKRDDAIILMKEVAEQPKAQPHHRRNFVLVLGLAKKEKEALALASADLSKSEIEALLKQAETIRSVSNPKAQAKALGTIL